MTVTAAAAACIPIAVVTVIVTVTVILAVTVTAAQQRRDARHGVRQAEGGSWGELACLSGE